jgi:hypothetical protein
LNEVVARAEVWRQRLGKTALDGLKVAARNLAVSLANTTYPQDETGYGKMADNIKQGLHRVYATHSSVYRILSQENPEAAGAYWEATSGKRKDNRRAARILAPTSLGSIPVASAPDPAIHQGARSGKRMHVLARKPRQIVTGKNGIDTYAKKVIRKIGRSASGWAWAAQDLGTTRGIPAMKGIKRHPTRTGAATAKASPDPSVVLHDQVAYVRSNLSEGRLTRAIKDCAKRLLKMLPKSLGRQRAL